MRGYGEICYFHLGDARLSRACERVIILPPSSCPPLLPGSAPLALLAAQHVDMFACTPPHLPPRHQPINLHLFQQSPSVKMASNKKEHKHSKGFNVSFCCTFCFFLSFCLLDFQMQRRTRCSRCGHTSAGLHFYAMLEKKKLIFLHF